MFDPLRPHGLQHARLPCPSLSPRVCSNWCPLSQWCHPTISSSVIPFSCPQIFPSIGIFFKFIIIKLILIIINTAKFWYIQSYTLDFKSHLEPAHGILENLTKVSLWWKFIAESALLYPCVVSNREREKKIFCTPWGCLSSPRGCSNCQQYLVLYPLKADNIFKRIFK